MKYYIGRCNGCGKEQVCQTNKDLVSEVTMRCKFCGANRKLYNKRNRLVQVEHKFLGTTNPRIVSKIFAEYMAQKNDVADGKKK